MDINECKKLLKALADDTRLQIFEMLRGGTLCGCKILEKLEITQPTLSHHMKILCDCCIVNAEKDWKWTYYSIDDNKLQELLDYLSCCKGNRSSGECC